MHEMVYKGFGELPWPLDEPSLLHTSDPKKLPWLTFYIDDFFGGFGSWQEQLWFLKHHFFPRIE